MCRWTSSFERPAVHATLSWTATTRLKALTFYSGSQSRSASRVPSCAHPLAWLRPSGPPLHLLHALLEHWSFISDVCMQSQAGVLTSRLQQSYRSGQLADWGYSNSSLSMSSRQEGGSSERTSSLSSSTCAKSGWKKCDRM